MTLGTRMTVPIGPQHPLLKEPVSVLLIKITFFTNADSEGEALEKGYTWLSDLKYKFRGLDGTVEIKPITTDSDDEWQNCRIQEIQIPDGLFSRRFDLLERFISAFYYDRKHKVQLVILWHRKPLSKNRVDPESATFSVKMFLNGSK